MWRKGKPPTLLVGMEIGVAAIENGMEVPLKIKKKTTINKATYDPAIPLL